MIGSGADGHGVAGWLRQSVFVLSMVVNDGDFGPNFLFRFAVWLVGVHSFLSVLSAGLAWLATRDHAVPVRLGQSNLRTVENVRHEGTSPGTRPHDGLPSHSLPVCLGLLVTSGLCLAHCASFISLLEFLGLVVFSMCSDERVQQGLKHQAQKLHVDWVDGLEPEVAHGAMVIIDMVICGLHFLRAVHRLHFAALILSYCNGFVALLELCTRVRMQIQDSIKRMADFPFATSAELRAHGDVCPVCLGSMSAARVTKCGHLFHGKCLRRALNLSPLCPMCKTFVLRTGVYLVDPMLELE